MQILTSSARKRHTVAFLFNEHHESIRRRALYPIITILTVTKVWRHFYFWHTHKKMSKTITFLWLSHQKTLNGVRFWMSLKSSRVRDQSASLLFRESVHSAASESWREHIPSFSFPQKIAVVAKLRKRAMLSIAVGGILPLLQKFFLVGLGISEPVRSWRALLRAFVATTINTSGWAAYPPWRFRDERKQSRGQHAARRHLSRCPTKAACVTPVQFLERIKQSGIRIDS